MAPCMSRTECLCNNADGWQRRTRTRFPAPHPHHPRPYRRARAAPLLFPPSRATILHSYWFLRLLPSFFHRSAIFYCARMKVHVTVAEETPMSLRLTTVYEKGVEWGG